MPRNHSDGAKGVASTNKDRSRGLTSDDLSSTLPADMDQQGQLNQFNDFFVDIDASQSQNQYSKLLDEEVPASSRSSDFQESSTEEEKEIDLTPGTLTRTDDPVRLYLKEMGSVSLLSRAGEISIAKRIEQGQKDISVIVFGMSSTHKY